MTKIENGEDSYFKRIKVIDKARSIS